MSQPFYAVRTLWDNAGCCGVELVRIDELPEGASHHPRSYFANVPSSYVRYKKDPVRVYIVGSDARDRSAIRTWYTTPEYALDAAIDAAYPISERELYSTLRDEYRMGVATSPSDDQHLEIPE